MLLLLCIFVAASLFLHFVFNPVPPRSWVEKVLFFSGEKRGSASVHGGDSFVARGIARPDNMGWRRQGDERINLHFFFSFLLARELEGGGELRRSSPAYNNRAQTNQGRKNTRRTQKDCTKDPTIEKKGMCVTLKNVPPLHFFLPFFFFCSVPFRLVPSQRHENQHHSIHVRQLPRMLEAVCGRRLKQAPHQILPLLLRQRRRPALRCQHR